MHVLIEVPGMVGTASWRERVRKPDQLNFARVCLWCGVRDCNSPRCVELHARSRWMVCDECDGLSAGDCLCMHGVVEAAPAEATSGDGRTSDGMAA